MKYPITILNLIECFKKLPGVGEKTAERYALTMLDMSEEEISFFSKTLKETKTKIRYCTKCSNYCEDELCDICKDKTRNNKIICVVEEPKNIVLFEKLNIYNGYYHVLSGLISPIEGINPEDINFSSLIDRIKKEKIEEVILALKPSIEGETTSLYISKILDGMNVKVSKIAHGVPMGAEIDYVDSLTLELALENRLDITNKNS